MSIILSRFQAAPLLSAHEKGAQTLAVSPDLGLSEVQVTLGDDDVRFPRGEALTWEQIAEIAESELNAFTLRDGELEKVMVYSEYTDRLYSLMPTGRAPTMLISGIPMHRIKNTDPHADTLAKIRVARPSGRVLDTATGLGYTAIEAAKRAHHVTTIELDPAALDIARQNPWSRSLFDNPKITQVIGDSFKEVQAFPDSAFDCIIHDPPTFSLAGDLYSGEMYAHLFRILRRGGRLFHYIGNLESPSGAGVARGSIRRLKAAGFRQIKENKGAFGLVARK
jgi:hypothetical protein